MKILMIAPQPFFTPRGTPLSVYYRTKTLADMGHQVDLLTYPMGRDVAVGGVNIIRGPRLPFIKKVKVGPSLPKLLLDVFLFFKAARLLLGRPYDVVHAHEEAVFFCLAFHALLKRKFIYDMHSSLPQQLENFNFTRMKPVVRLFEYLERRSIEKASAVITICNDLERQVEKYGFGHKNELIQNTLFFPLSFRERTPEISLREFARTGGKRVVFYAGTFESYQGIDMYLESISTVTRDDKDVLFVLIGGDPEQVESMREKARDLGVLEHTRFTGTLDVNMVKRFLGEADVLVSPRTKGTNTPLKIYEYMASGVPIVATDLPTHTQELDAESAFLREPRPEDFGRGILECLSDREEAKRRARNARALYDGKYGEDLYVEKLGRILERVGSGPLEAGSAFTQ